MIIAPPLPRAVYTRRGQILRSAVSHMGKVPDDLVAYTGQTIPCGL